MPEIPAGIKRPKFRLLADLCGSACVARRRSGEGNGPLEQLLELAQSKKGDEHSSSQTDSAESRPDGAAGDMITCRTELAAMRAELERVKTAERVLEQVQSLCRELEERFYDREVLGPIGHGLVGIADRCRQQVWRIESTLRRAAHSDGRYAAEALIQLREARTADRVEVESLLAHLGVEPFENPRRTFDPASQKCVTRREGVRVHHDPRRSGRCRFRERRRLA